MLDIAFVDVLRRHLKYLKPNDDLDMNIELKLLGLDSLSAIDLLLDIEDTYGIAFPEQYLIAETFATGRSLQEVIDTLRVNV